MRMLIVILVSAIVMTLVKGLLKQYGFLYIEGEIWARILHEALCMLVGIAIWTAGGWFKK